MRWGVSESPSRSPSAISAGGIVKSGLINVMQGLNKAWLTVCKQQKNMFLDRAPIEADGTKGEAIGKKASASTTMGSRDFIR